MQMLPMGAKRMQQDCYLVLVLPPFELRRRECAADSLIAYVAAQLPNNESCSKESLMVANSSFLFAGSDECHCSVVVQMHIELATCLVAPDIKLFQLLS